MPKNWHFKLRKQSQQLLTVSKASGEGVVTMRNFMPLTSLIRSRMASLMPGGISTIKKSKSPHNVVAKSSMRAFEMSAPLKGSAFSFE
jgi:hypothetical protein